MDAQVYQMGPIRSQRSMHTSLEKIFQTHLALAGLAMTQSALSLWGEYVRGLASYHVAVISAACSHYSKPQKIAGPW